MDNVEFVDLIRNVIKEELVPVKEELSLVREDVAVLKVDVAVLKTDVSSMNDRLSVLEIKHDMTHRKLDNLEFYTKSMEREIKKDLALTIDGQQTLIAVLEAKGILPRVEGQ